MEKGIEFMKQRLSHMEVMLGALKDLYAALTPEQRAIADKHFSHMAKQRRERMHHATK
jgi:Spy/CpxP family protein refolding chaperone